MRSREEIRDHAQRLFQEQDVHKRAFRLFMIDIELMLDIREGLQRIEDLLAEKPVDKKPSE